MARLSIQSERVKHLVGTQVLPLLLAAGNVAALTKLLNDTLQTAGIEGRLHPNRLHALLSNDVTRSLNEATVDLTEQAARAALEVDRTIAERAAVALKTLQDEAHKLRAFSADSLDEIAERLSIPPALAARLLGETPSTTGMGATGALRPAGAITIRHEPPDWSYQDTAVARCLDAFNRRPAGRVGLVLPTGAGKTRTALRIVLAMLSKNLDSKAPAYWVTHRRNLREQAYRELQKLIAGQDDRLEGERLAELANRIKFVMVSDLTPLAKLSKLMRLDVGYTQVTSLEPLAGLRALEDLRADATHVSDLTPLKETTSLMVLSVAFTPVSDVTPIAGLVHLKNLVLARTDVQDIGPLKQLTQLWSLDIQGTPIRDFSPLTGLTSLRRLAVGEPLPRERYNARTPIDVYALNLNWQTFDGQKQIQDFLAGPGRPRPR